MTKEICWTFGGGILVQVSDEDFPYLCGFHWSISKDGYTVARINKKLVKMHRIIVLELMKLIIPEGKEIDHEDRNKNNYQRENLRIITHQQNMNNIGARKNSKLGIKGIYFHKASGKYEVDIKINGKKIYLGLFNSLIQAQEARIAAEIYYGV